MVSWMRPAMLSAVVMLAALAPSRSAAAQGAPAAAAAPAQPTADQITRAKTLFDLGAKAYDSEQFPAAIQAFKEAYRLSQRAGPLFSTAQAYRRLYNVDRNAGNLRDAIAHYKEYLEKQKTGGRTAEAQQALRDLESLSAQVAAATSGASPGAAATAVVDVAPKTRLMVSSPTKGATASLDGGEAAEMPLIQELPLGKHTLRIAAEGFIDDEREIVPIEGQVYGLDIPLRERPALLTIRATPGADVLIDGRSEGFSPLVRPLELASGSHLVTITKTGYHPYSAEVELKRAEKRPLEVTLERTSQRYASFVSFGAAAVGGVAGGVLAGLALHEQAVAQEIDTRRKTGNISDAERAVHNEAFANRDGLRTAAMAAFGAFGLLAVVGAGLFVFDRSAPGVPTKLGDDATKPPAGAIKRATKVTASAVPVVGPSGGGAVVTIQF
jgi:hypothetical protein